VTAALVFLAGVAFGASMDLLWKFTWDMFHICRESDEDDA
jgi:hypothetical protein